MLYFLAYIQNTIGAFPLEVRSPFAPARFISISRTSLAQPGYFQILVHTTTKWDGSNLQVITFIDWLVRTKQQTPNNISHIF